MTADDQFIDLIKKTNEWTIDVRNKNISLSDYYFKMADYFNQIEPNKGEHMGSWFDFGKDAKEFVELAKKELQHEKQ